ncbi:MAG: rhodanese-like domain-containing protein [Bacteroidota bacterium]
MSTFLFILSVLALLMVYNYIRSKGNYEAITVADVEQVKKEHPNVTFIDVRTPSEIAGGKIDKSLEINVQSSSFKQQLANLPKEQAYVVYCRSGARSALACNLMAKQGFETLYNLKGGYMAWAAKQ